jgi:hypothetical protein
VLQRSMDKSIENKMVSKKNIYMNIEIIRELIMLTLSLEQGHS